MEKLSKTPLLDKINKPKDLKFLTISQLEQLASELRCDIIDIVSKTGGHLGANLGVVELSIALHKVFNTPDDKIIWDVGHQSYPHKILTSRRKEMQNLRQKDGVSGFPKRSESPYDAFGAGHSSTSISAALGMNEAIKYLNEDRDVVAVIGDGSMTAGMAFEAMNHAGELGSKLIVVLNDNDMSIDPPTGALSKHLTHITSRKEFKNLRDVAKSFSRFLPGGVERGRFFEDLAREVVSGEGANLFNSLGFLYFGPIDGHDLPTLISVLENLKQADYDTPVLLHIKTVKGKGYKPAEMAHDRLHGVTEFNPETGKLVKKLKNTASWTSVFAESLTNIAQKDNKVMAITAAMPSGTGLKIMQEQLPRQVYDVGIAEQHAVTFAAGLACEGFKPFVALYSTFLQRAWDQVIHDVALQKLPVRFMIDRAGYVGADGATHAGLLDLTMLATQPHFVVMAPSSAEMLRDMVYTAYQINDRPSAIRYPRGNCEENEMVREPQALAIGKGRIIQQGCKVAILSVGTSLSEALKAAEALKAENIIPTLADACFVSPLDTKLIDELVQNHDILITVEENTIGGFGSLISQYLLNQGHLDGDLKFRALMAPAEPIEHGEQSWQTEQAGIDAKSIVEKIKSIL